jgi:8-oxo-dGTP pyrophosphatase MutT (NUDIX family)
MNGLENKKKKFKKKKDEYNPITSYGLIVYSLDSENIPYFLLYQRRDNFEYMDFLRGIWHKQEMLPPLFSAMSNDERQRLRQYTFQELWDDLWVEHNCRIYRDGFARAKRKYDSVKHLIPYILDSTSSDINDTPWGFPKGKKNNFHENPITCAVREFKEETHIHVDKENIVNEQPYIERFQGSNDKKYSTYYYLTKIPNIVYPKKIITSGRIRSEAISEEASNLKWVSYPKILSYLHPRRQVIIEQVMKDLKLIEI